MCSKVDLQLSSNMRQRRGKFAVELYMIRWYMKEFGRRCDNDDAVSSNKKISCCACHRNEQTTRLRILTSTKQERLSARPMTNEATITFIKQRCACACCAILKCCEGNGERWKDAQSTKHSTEFGQDRKNPGNFWKIRENNFEQFGTPYLSKVESVS